MHQLSKLTCLCVAALSLFSCSQREASGPAGTPQERQYSQALFGLARDKAGRLNVTFTTGFVARIDDLKGKHKTILGTKASDVGDFQCAMGIGLDSKGRVYVTDEKKMRIVRFDDMDGSGWKTFDCSSGELATIGLRALAIDSRDRIYIADEARNQVMRMDDIDGRGLVRYGSSGKGIGQFHGLASITCDAQGRIYLGDAGNGRIVRIDDMDGSGWTSYGSAGDGVGQFRGIYGLALDSKGRIFVSDAHNNRIVRIDGLDGGGWKEWRSERKKDDPMFPVGILVDEKDRIWYSDMANAQVCRMNDMEGSGWTCYKFSN